MIIALSGGLDSSTLLAHSLDCGYEVLPVIFHYGQKHQKEIQSALAICTHYEVEPLQMEIVLPKTGALLDPTVPVPPLTETIGHPQPPTYVPFRNLIFASYLACIAESVGDTHIGLGFHRSDTYGYWDTTQDFANQFQELLGLNRKHYITVYVPFLHQTKGDIAKTAKRLGVPISLTWSCYAGGDTPCGVCATCKERETALLEAGVI